jgi:signal transduction histidine kinase
LAIKSEADRMANIIRQLLDFARRRMPERTSVDLRHVTNQCVDLLRSLATKHNVELVVSGNESLTANVDAAQIQQVVTNLVVNAIQAMPDGGTVSIDVQQRRAQPPGVTDATEETYCCLAVRDEGRGVSDDDRRHLFEPFFTTKDVGEGTGLGLSVSYGIVQDHHGWIDVKSEPGKGSCFTVFLPSLGTASDASTSANC